MIVLNSDRTDNFVSRAMETFNLPSLMWWQNPTAVLKTFQLKSIKLTQKKVRYKLL